MKALVVLSGGQDSTTCLYYAINKYGRDNVITLTFNYGQRHRVEIESAIKIASSAGIAGEVVEIDDILKGSSPLTDLSKEVGQYASADALPGGLEDTFVPGRNMLFLTVAANRAYVYGCDKIIIGVSQEDFGGYPDCRIQFIISMQNAICDGLDKGIEIETPLINLTKKQTVEMAVQLPLANECMSALAYSHTCYNGIYPPCGKCHACLLRAKGFQQANVVDPLLERCNYHGQ